MMCGLCIASCPQGALRFNKSSKDLTWDDEIIYVLRNVRDAELAKELAQKE